MIEFLAHVSVITNRAIVYFTSFEYREFFIQQEDDETHEVCLGTTRDFCMRVPIKWKLFSTTLQFTLFVVAIEHLVFFIKVFINKAYQENHRNLEKVRQI